MVAIVVFEVVFEVVPAVVVAPVVVVFVVAYSEVILVCLDVNSFVGSLDLTVVVFRELMVGSSDLTRVFSIGSSVVVDSTILGVV